MTASLVAASRHRIDPVDRTDQGRGKVRPGRGPVGKTSGWGKPRAPGGRRTVAGGAGAGTAYVAVQTKVAEPVSPTVFLAVTVTV